jgi:tripartite ATP-independent transporter DctP family solute receptor
MLLNLFIIIKGEDFMNKLRKAISVFVLFILAGSLLAACTEGKPNASNSSKSEVAKTSAKKYTFRLADTHPKDYPTVIGDQKFAALVNERSAGRIHIDVYPNSQLGEEKAVVEQLQLGAIEFTRVSSGILAEYNKQFGVFSLPFIFENDAHLWKFLLSEHGNKMLDTLETAKMKGLAYYSSGARSFYSSKKLSNLTELKGQKIRVLQNKLNIELMTILGANPVPMAYGEVFNALQSGDIDAAENNFPSYLSSNHYKQAKNYILDKHQRVPEVLLISLVTWNKLDEETRKIIKQAAIDSVITQRESWDQFEQEAEAKVRTAGTVITDVTDFKPWQTAVKPIIDKYRQEYKEELEAIEAARNT